ncbi:junctional cadherin 5-associated protein [Ahaetulla prasina]|uniref:junctional cadherin 5-associated protein n=1 Tax=Ahaetulla prasina TaxID=499056 RepID=UPI0026483331|nr:junctional cadherin 5-associated protein [Ahaetulla prasina]XP_058040309.1 junctional cadherin 5-associated protein [Ahaetulla prasina]
MFSVDDLLISHGYKPSKSPTNSSGATGGQHEDTGRQSGQATKNGLPIHPGAIPKTNKARRYLNDNENKLAVRGKPRNTNHEYFSDPGNVQGGLYDQSLSRSSPSKKEKDFASWKRQCHDFSVYDYPGKVDNEIRGMGATCALFDNENKVQWENEERLENLRSNKQEAMKPPGDYRRQSLKMETWKQPSAFGRREHDTDNKKRLLQDVYSGRENIAASHVKNKPQSFPGFFSSENSNFAEIPAVASSKEHIVKPELESLKYFEPATRQPVTRPKYGRPLKPPPYEYHQQSRGIIETNPPQDEQQKRKTTFYVTKVDEPDQDSTLGPPLYVPPPSYKSGQQSKNDMSKEVPDYSECFPKDVQTIDQDISISSGSSVNQLQEDEESISNSETQVRCQEKQQSSVQYIPFDDPRIRHIKVIHPPDHHQMEDQAEDANNSSVFHKNYVDQEFNDVEVDLSDSINPALKSNQVSGRSKWLVETSDDLDSGALSTQRGSYDTGKNLNSSYLKARSSAQSPGATELSSEIFTKVKTFEPGTEIQGKNNLKKKTSEAMFCLVYVPPQSELNMAGVDRNNNAIQGSAELYENDSNRDLKEQSFLSTSSTDLELEALTGNMLNKNVLEKQDFQRPEFKQMNYFSCKQPPKHKGLEYSGSLPCTRYKDQETQTCFIEEPQIQQPLQGPQHGSQLRKSNTLTNGHFLKYGSSTTEPAPSRLPISNRKDRPIPPPRKTQFNKPSKPESPRTVVSSKTSQNELCATSTGLPGQKNEPSFAHKEERKSPCSVKEAFGQFLLKPVSRRPWDAISELESFNKEIQNQDESSEDDKENDQRQDREGDKKVEKAEGKACRVDEVSQDHICSAEAKKVKPATSLFKNGTNKSKSKSESGSKIPETRVVLGDLRNVRSEAREMDKSVKEKKGNDLNQRQDNARKIIKQAISLHPMKSNVSGRWESGNSKPLNRINSGEGSVEKDKEFDKMNKIASRNTPASKTASVAPLSFKKRNQGRSEPNLRSAGLDVNEGTNIPGSSTKKILSNESLRTRASRILGIEVAVESLTADNKTLPDGGANKMAQSRKLSDKKIPRAEMKINVASSKGKPKSGWSKSTLIGENNFGSVKNQCSGEEKLAREQYFLDKHQEDHAPTLESAVLPLAGRKSLASNIEKKTKSISKVTVPRQGKVASAVSRAAMDRIARMKEVDSVSRMRRLTIKNAEDRDEERQLKETERKGNDSAVVSTELPRKLSQGSCVSKRIISLDENEHLGHTNAKKNGKDLPSSEAYDPSQVERV